MALALDAFLLRAIVKENERYEGVLHTMAKWVTDEERLEFLRKFGWLMKDAAVNAYSAKFKPKK